MAVRRRTYALKRRRRVYAVRRSRPVGFGYKRRRVHRRKRGGGLWDSIKSAHNWIKSNKVKSRVGNALSSIGVPYAGTIGSTAATLGYGKRKRRRVGRPRITLTTLVPRRQRRRVLASRVYVGGSLRGLATSAHRFVKDRRLISGALSHFGHPRFASSLGYGAGIQPLGLVRF